METHPHLQLFNAETNWKYLIVGTFPPNTSIRNNENIYIDYFYGNKGFLWKIIHDLYHQHGYNFFTGNRNTNLSEIKRWQHDYCVAITDTIIACNRKSPFSSNDSDLINIQYNYPLKQAILDNISQIEKIIFTSSFGKNSAFENFRIIMGTDLGKITTKLITGLPSPSGSANITFFNTNKEETLGLTVDFFNYVRTHRPELLAQFQKRWIQKKQKRDAPDNNRSLIAIDATPKGLVKEYKLWKYSQVLPAIKCH